MDEVRRREEIVMSTLTTAPLAQSQQASPGAAEDQSQTKESPNAGDEDSVVAKEVEKRSTGELGESSVGAINGDGFIVGAAIGSNAVETEASTCQCECHKAATEVAQYCACAQRHWHLIYVQYVKVWCTSCTNEPGISLEVGNVKNHVCR